MTTKAATNTLAETNPIKRTIRKPTYLNAIKAMCAHCMGCTDTHLEPGFRESISTCTARGCPLYGFRPYVDSGTLAAPEKGAE
jgi:hypothetical protein